VSTVLVLDDQSISRMILEELVRSIGEHISVRSFSDPVAALQWAKDASPDLVITDYKMPNMDGVEFIQWLRQIPSCKDVPVVVITCVEDKSIRYRALEAGATDFLYKPIDHYECRARCRNLLQLKKQQGIIKDRAHWLEKEVFKKTSEIQLREKETLLRLARAGEYRDEETGNHVIRMAEYSYLVSCELGLEKHECEVIRHAAPMHDIGKIGISDEVLLKEGMLNDAEWRIMQNHCQVGHDILKDSPSYYLKSGATIALGHHERFDGKGYPEGVSGTAIPIEARVVTVADVFDALQSDRPYRKGWSLDRTLEYMRGQRGEQFDPDCIDAFFSQLDAVLNIKNRFSDEAGIIDL